ncbi:hypothetical protein Tco_0396482 [Tanacetum coccineum]
MLSSTVSYTSVYTDSDPWRFQWVSNDELEASDAVPQSPGHAPPSPDYVPGPKHPTSPDYVPSPEEPEQAPLSPIMYLSPSTRSTWYHPTLRHLCRISLYQMMLYPQPYHRAMLLTPDDASPLDLEEDPEEDSEEDLADYPADGGRYMNEDSHLDDDDDDEEEEHEAFEDDDKEEEEHPTLADSPTVPVDDLVPLAEDIEAFETDESVPTPVSSPRRRTTRISVRSQTLMSAGY